MSECRRVHGRGRNWRSCPRPDAGGRKSGHPDEIAELENSCSTSRAERAESHANEPLYFRLGRYDRIRKLTGKIIRLHLQNDSIKHLFQGIGPSRLADLGRRLHGGGHTTPPRGALEPSVTMPFERRGPAANSEIDAFRLRRAGHWPENHHAGRFGRRREI